MIGLDDNYANLLVLWSIRLTKWKINCKTQSNQCIIGFQPISWRLKFKSRYRTRNNDREIFSPFVYQSIIYFRISLSTSSEWKETYESWSKCRVTMTAWSWMSKSEKYYKHRHECTRTYGTLALWCIRPDSGLHEKMGRDLLRTQK